jgi:hypothetical protein
LEVVWCLIIVIWAGWTGWGELLVELG